MLIVGSGASALVHRTVYEAARQGPTHIAEFGLALLTFMLASAGTLLLIHGGNLLERDYALGVAPQAQPIAIAARLKEPIKADGRIYDTRHGASLMQARHAIQTSRRLSSDYTTDGWPLHRGKRSIFSTRR